MYHGKKNERYERAKGNVLSCHVSCVLIFEYNVEMARWRDGDFWFLYLYTLYACRLLVVVDRVLYSIC